MRMIPGVVVIKLGLGESVDCISGVGVILDVNGSVSDIVGMEVAVVVAALGTMRDTV